MKRSIALILAVFVFAAVSAFAQADNIQKVPLSQTETDRIVKAFTDHEAQFRTALTNYVFNRSANISTVGMGGQITGTFRLDSFMALTQSGERIEKILFAPISTLTEM